MVDFFQKLFSTVQLVTSVVKTNLPRCEISGAINTIKSKYLDIPQMSSEMGKMRKISN